METKQFNFVCANVPLCRGVARKKICPWEKNQQLPFKYVGVTARKTLEHFDGASPREV